MLGYALVALFLVAWGLSVAIWKLGRFEERYAAGQSAHAHFHAHGDGAGHTHRHFHD